VPTWFVVLLGLLACAWVASGLRDSAEAKGFHRVDPTRVSLAPAGSAAGLPSEWSALLAAQLARLGELSTLDDSLVERVRAEVSRLAFVAEVGEARVLWPDGVSLDVRLREPVACVQSGLDFMLVARDGIILPGYWTEPPDFGLGYLPVLGPSDSTFDLSLPGDLLTERRHLDALSVAASMRDYLTPGEIARIGRFMIDATDADKAGVGQPGTRLWLEEQRRVLWGRVPRSMAPGELPEREKWNHVMTAIGYLEADSPLDWDLVDVRWDTATLRPR
jgi:hypothetical protein